MSSDVINDDVIGSGTGLIEFRCDAVGNEMVADVGKPLGVVMQLAKHRDKTVVAVGGALPQVVLREELAAEWIPIAQVAETAQRGFGETVTEPVGTWLSVGKFHVVGTWVSVDKFHVVGTWVVDCHQTGFSAGNPPTGRAGASTNSCSNCNSQTGQQTDEQANKPKCNQANKPKCNQANKHKNQASKQARKSASKQALWRQRSASTA
jgi:hypothetical protein